MGENMRVAIIEDDVLQAQHLAVCLEEMGCDCHFYQSGKEAMRALQKESFDLILLDWLLPDVGGDEVLRWIRENLDWQVPVIFVTQKDSAEDLAYALGNGADDYITKPIKVPELLARIQAVVRRTSGVGPGHQVLEFGHHVIDLERREIRVDGEKVPLTQKEFELAAFFFRNNGRLLSRAHLMENVWGHGEDVNTRTLDTHISRLRKKLQLNTDKGWRLSSVYHHGYRLEAVDVPEQETVTS